MGKNFTVMWNIDVEAETALAAAEQVWYDVFGRDKPNHDDACVFTVVDEDARVFAVDLGRIQ